MTHRRNINVRCFGEPSEGIIKTGDAFSSVRTFEYAAGGAEATRAGHRHERFLSRFG
jgi:hypothetical protein